MFTIRNARLSGAERLERNSRSRLPTPAGNPLAITFALVHIRPAKLTAIGLWNRLPQKAKRPLRAKWQRASRLRYVQKSTSTLESLQECDQIVLLLFR